MATKAQKVFFVDDDVLVHILSSKILLFIKTSVSMGNIKGKQTVQANKVGKLQRPRRQARARARTQSPYAFIAAHASGAFDKLRPYFRAEPSQARRPAVTMSGLSLAASLGAAPFQLLANHKVAFIHAQAAHPNARASVLAGWGGARGGEGRGVGAGSKRRLFGVKEVEPAVDWETLSPCRSWRRFRTCEDFFFFLRSRKCLKK